MLADLKQRLKRRSFTDLLRDASPDPMGFRSNREVATELFHLTGLMPYLGDRHTCEFFPHYITSRTNLRKYKLIRTTIAERRGGLVKRRSELRRMVRDGIDNEGHLKRSRETAADIIDAHHEGRVFIDVGNLPNVGQISNLPRGVVVETAVRVDRNGFSPITFGALPPLVQGLVEPCALTCSLTVEACFNGDKDQALAALRLDPVCAHLNTEKLNDMGNRLLRAHRRFASKVFS